jgi:hypothetical protein
MTWHTPEYIGSLFNRFPYRLEHIPVEVHGLNLYGQDAHVYQRSP